MEDKVSIEAKIDSAKISVSGSSAERVSNQVSDLISPFSELLGAAGDRLRIWRQKSVIEALDQAHRTAKDLNINIEPVAPKFLVSWVEKASLEDDSMLSGKWANLLLKSMGEFDSASIWAANILSELGTDEVVFLDSLVHNFEKIISATKYHSSNKKLLRTCPPAGVIEAKSTYDHFTEEGMLCSHKKMHDVFTKHPEKDEISLYFHDEIGSSYKDASYFIHYFKITPHDEKSYFSSYVEGGYWVYLGGRENDVTIEYLKLKGLVEEFKSNIELPEGFTTIKGLRFTLNGIRFMHKMLL